MACKPGEENVATMFGDVHYFYGDPDAIPPHHRFDKGSYVYLFENAGERRARIEIANHPGTENQDAFDGFLDNTRVSYSYKHSCMVNIVVEGASQVQGTEAWHLPTYDPSNQTKYHYKLHSLDIYFWTPRDAVQFVNGVRRVLPSAQVDVRDEPAPPPPSQPSSPPGNMAGVVQKLEQVAISSEPQHTHQVRQAPAMTATAVQRSSETYVPMAYNPAAPAAPEQVRPREKTPPPEFLGGVNPLHVAVAQDQMLSPSFAPPPPPPGTPPPLSQTGYYPQQQHSYPGGMTPLQSPNFAPPGGIMTPLQSPGFAAAAHHPGLGRVATMPSGGAVGMGGLMSPGLRGGSSQTHVPPPPPPPVTQPPQQLQQQMIYSTPTPPVGGIASAPPAPAPAKGQARPGTGGSGGTTGTTGTTATGAGTTDYSVHQQVYRATDEELRNSEIATGEEKKERILKNSKKLEENAGRLERGVTGMLKRFEKKFG